jgi:hypothetical protein
MGDNRGLHSEQNEESDHQTEETHGFGQGESQDGVGEQLLLQRWVPGEKKRARSPGSGLQDATTDSSCPVKGNKSITNTEY